MNSNLVCVSTNLNVVVLIVASLPSLSIGENEKVSLLLERTQALENCSFVKNEEPKPTCYSRPTSVAHPQTLGGGEKHSLCECKA